MSGQYVDWCGWFKQYGNIIIINPAILFFLFWAWNQRIYMINNDNNVSSFCGYNCNLHREFKYNRVTLAVQRKT